MNNIRDIPSEIWIIVDKNIFEYIRPSFGFGSVCRNLIYRIESGDIHGCIPHPVVYEILLLLMIEEIIRSGYAPKGISSVRFLKNNPETITQEIFELKM
ncbi:hypothetical protein [Methanospirillum sp.]